MKIKVRDKIYDGKEEPIMVILTDHDKRNIAHMHPDNAKYCQFPETLYKAKEIIKWMDDKS